MADDFDPDVFAGKAKAKNAPADAGFDPDGFVAKASGKVAPKAKPPEIDRLEGMSRGDKFWAGAGLGGLSSARSLAELSGHVPGLGGLSRSALAALPEIDPEFSSALLADPKHSIPYHIPDVVPVLGGDHRLNFGNVGNFLGEAGATAPLGGLASGVARRAVGTAVGKVLLPALAAKAIPILAEGAAQGTVLGGPDNRALGALTGAAFAGGGSAVAGGLGALARGIVKPTPAAQALMAEGVPLSIGQMEPGGALSKMEEAGQHSALGGESIQEARQLARDEFQRAAAKKALAPGDTLPEGSLRAGDFVEQMNEGFKKAYESMHKTPMPTHYEGVPVRQVVRDAFNGVSTDPTIMADEATRQSVNKFLQNQATILDRAKHFDLQGNPVSPASAAARVNPTQPLLPASTLGIRAPLEQWSEAPLSADTGNMRRPSAAGPAPASTSSETFTTAEPLLTMRSNIRAEMRSPGVAGTPQGRMLGNAEDLITKALEERLGPEGAAKLRATDGQYAKFMALNRAVAAAGDSPFGFTPAQLSAAAQKGLSATAKARGYGGPLRDLGSLGREVLDERAPRTGAIKQTLPLGLNHAAGPLMSILNGPGREFALGLTGPQKAAVTFGDLLRATLPKSSVGPNALVAPLEVDAARGQ